MKFIAAAGRVVMSLIFGIMKLFPVRDKVTFISRQSDQPGMDFRLLGGAILKLRPNTEIVYLCKRIPVGAGGRTLYLGEILRQMWHIATSSKVILDSYCIPISVLKQRPETEVVQIWHAIGVFKKFGFSIVGNEGEGRSRALADSMNMHGNYDKIMVSTPLAVEPFGEAFGYDKDAFFIGSLPRVDMLTSPEYRESKAKEIMERYPEIKAAKEAGQKVVVYAPTFRVKSDISERVISLMETLKRGGMLVVIKKHPIMELPEGEDILTCPDFDTMEMLTLADVVICDYSAIAFEAALLGKPMVFYAFDLDYYKDNRDFYIDFEAEMPGPICRTEGEVLDAINKDSWDRQAIKAFADKYVTVQKNAGENIVKQLFHI